MFFFNFSQYFPVNLGLSIDIHIRIHYHFHFVSGCWPVGKLRWLVGLHQLVFPPVAQTSSNATDDKPLLRKSSHLGMSKYSWTRGWSSSALSQSVLRRLVQLICNWITPARATWMGPDDCTTNCTQPCSIVITPRMIWPYTGSNHNLSMRHFRYITPCWKYISFLRWDSSYSAVGGNRSQCTWNRSKAYSA